MNTKLRQTYGLRKECALKKYIGKTMLTCILAAGDLAGLALAPNSHEEGFQLDLVQLLEGSLDVALVGSQHGDNVLPGEVPLGAQLVILSKHQ